MENTVSCWQRTFDLGKQLNALSAVLGSNLLIRRGEIFHICKGAASLSQGGLWSGATSAGYLSLSVLLSVACRSLLCPDIVHDKAAPLNHRPVGFFFADVRSRLERSLFRHTTADEEETAARSETPLVCLPPAVNEAVQGRNAAAVPCFPRALCVLAAQTKTSV